MTTSDTPAIVTTGQDDRTPLSNATEDMARLELASNGLALALHGMMRDSAFVYDELPPDARWRVVGEAIKAAEAAISDEAEDVVR